MIRILGLDWGDANRDHIWERHQVTVAQVEQAVKRRVHEYRSKGVLVALATTDSGRYLTLVLKGLGSGQWRPITARDMTDREKRLAARLIERRGGS